MLLAGIGDCKQFVNTSLRRRLPDTPQVKENVPFNPYEKSIANQLRNIRKSKIVNLPKRKYNQEFIEDSRYINESDNESYSVENFPQDSYDLEEWQFSPPPTPAPSNNMRYGRPMMKQVCFDIPITIIISCQISPQDVFRNDKNKNHMARYDSLRQPKRKPLLMHHQCSLDEEHLDSAEEYDERIDQSVNQNQYEQDYNNYMMKYAPPNPRSRYIAPRNCYIDPRMSRNPMPDLISNTDWLLEKCQNIPVMKSRINTVRIVVLPSDDRGYCLVVLGPVWLE